MRELREVAVQMPMSDIILPPGYLDFLRGDFLRDVFLRAGWRVTTSSTGPDSFTFIAMPRLPSRRSEPAPAPLNRAARRAGKRGDL